MAFLPAMPGQNSKRCTLIQRKYTIQSTLCSSRKVIQEVTALVQFHTADEQMLYEIKLALTEALSNIVLHAYQGKNKGRINLRLQLDLGRFLRFVLIDHGIPFQAPADKIANISPENESGRGLFLISRLMDSFRYRHCKQNNILVLQKIIKEL